ncbi:hypothetical protein BH18ACT7_BH18ACT7_26200 [soil metagenome]
MMPGSRIARLLMIVVVLGLVLSTFAYPAVL